MNRASSPAAAVSTSSPNHPSTPRPLDPSTPITRLTRLELHGFKSFAARTVFAFEPGITAIVGPNGSGKSNVADAVRWVLGEQSHGALRSKKTEDVVFAGGQGRAPAGMAEAALTFDNRDRWLPIDFAEVTVTRRAFRSGENHYLINNRRVRLKDVAVLVASLGQSHTVVGQGLIDAALSQRAEERRGLFEHAADLAGLRLKAAEAERSLAETQANSTRLNDLLTELEPRLKTLERAARQAKEWRGLNERLRTLQGAHYRRLLRAARRTLAAAETAAAEGAAAVRTAQAEVDRLLAAGEAAREAAEAARAALGRHAARLQAVVDQARRVGHERDLAAERHAALGRRRDDMADTQAGLDEQMGNVAAELARVAADLATIEAELAAVRNAAAALQEAGAAARRARAQLERRVADLARTLGEQDRRGADLARRRALLEQRRETDAVERERAIAAATERAERVARVEAEQAAAEVAARVDEADLADLDARLTDLGAEAERAAAAARTARTELDDAERGLGQAQTRLEVLRRLHDSGAGLYAGVRETLRAARDGKLGGVRGTVAELVETPPGYDTAVEVALGAHLQDVVVARWADAEAAILHLKRANAGRATFQPLDTVRGPGRGPRHLPREALALPGAHGVASELVRAAPELAGVVGALLGRTLVVEDLATARAAIPLLPAGWSAVTLAGELARTGGSVTGGAAVKESGVLARERELRELPKEIGRLETARAEASERAEAAAAEPRRLAVERQTAEAERAGRAAAARERLAQRRRLAGWLQELRRERDAVDARVAALADAAERAAVDLADLERGAAALAEATAATSAEHEAALADLARETEAAAVGERELAAEQRRLAALEERQRAERRRQAGLLAQEKALAEEVALRNERAAALDGERAALAAQHERLAQEAEGLDRARAAAIAERPPLEAAVRRADGAATRLARELEAARAALLDRERLHGSGGLAVERARGDLAALRQRIADDLELGDPDALLAGAETEESESPPAGDAEREIAWLKERLRRVGYVGEDVVAEYEREAAHQAFLRGQLADIEGAAAALRQLLTDLDATMRRRFDETFALVATAFAETFATLFGGGSARLTLTAGEDGAPPGVEIVAQPPGKRLQSLALLSGGERALTAAALLIAILRVNPAPFCLLDEVDAALDEANIVRFREQLRTLAAETQVIVITHNRGTIETADTLYGVSMGDDGVSQVLSLRLTETAAD